ncbi:MAG: amidohydrolase family protein [Bilophila sp.]
METASHIYRNGTILTMNSGGTQAEALAVRDGIILAAGSERQIMALAGKDTVITDLRGRTMLPGFIDGHSHFVSAGLMAATQLDLLPARGRRAQHRGNQGTRPPQSRRNPEGGMDPRLRLRRHRP